MVFVLFSSRRRHTRCALVTGVQTCALPISAAEIRVTGQEWTFAPTITVPQDGRWGRAYEGYSSDPKLVSDYVGQFIRGLQGEPGAPDILKGPHVIASTKHFLADGGTEDGPDQGGAAISEAELRDLHGLPYVPALAAGMQTGSEEHTSELQSLMR